MIADRSYARGSTSLLCLVFATGRDHINFLSALLDCADAIFCSVWYVLCGFDGATH